MVIYNKMIIFTPITSGFLQRSLLKELLATPQNSILKSIEQKDGFRSIALEKVCRKLKMDRHWQVFIRKRERWWKWEKVLEANPWTNSRKEERFNQKGMMASFLCQCSKKFDYLFRFVVSNYTYSIVNKLTAQPDESPRRTRPDISIRGRQEDVNPEGKRGGKGREWGIGLRVLLRKAVQEFPSNIPAFPNQAWHKTKHEGVWEQEEGCREPELKEICLCGRNRIRFGWPSKPRSREFGHQKRLFRVI